MSGVMSEEDTESVNESAGLLAVHTVSKSFGGLQALKDIDLVVERGSIVGLIGPNGAGKTTLFNLITGIFPPTEGDIRFEGEDLLRSGGRRRRPFQITRAGIGRTFQNIRLFAEMTALENVTVGADAHHRQNVLDAVFRTPRHRREDPRARPSPRSCWSSPPSTATRTSWPATCPTVTSAGSRSPGPSPPGPSCCSSTSRPRA